MLSLRVLKVSVTESYLEAQGSNSKLVFPYHQAALCMPLYWRNANEEKQCLYNLKGFFAFVLG